MSKVVKKDWNVNNIKLIHFATKVGSGGIH